MKRLLTAVLLIPAVAYVALRAPEWLFLAVVALVASLCFREYGSIVAAHGIDRPGAAGYTAGLLLLVVPIQEGLLLTLAAILAMILALRSDPPARSLPRAAATVLGVVYLFGCWRCAGLLRSISPYWLFFVLSLSWLGDTAAYYVGSAIGRHKLAPRLSPAKSWEGGIASLAVSLVFGFLYLAWLMPLVPVPQRLVISALANVAGQAGDLAESGLKRGAAIKDSSNLLPGHGGWLDRVDSTLFAMPVVYALLNLPW